MRLLLACTECKRQYDASGRQVGARFHCHCGSVMVVRPPAGHDARVVRCSGCGAPREEEASACRFCSADFTLHEQDLHTVCPECLARVSDRAKFCHACGVSLTPEFAAGDETQLHCPDCAGEKQLVSRRLGAEAVTVLECGVCAGFWLGNEAFVRLTERAAKEAYAASAKLAGARRPSRAAPTGRWKYRNCPVCGHLMQRHNYGHRSGVIIDVCGNDGVWFDADELPRILAWIRAGGLKDARQRPGASPQAASPRAVPPAASRGGLSFPPATDTPDEDLFIDVALVLGRIFSR